MIEIKNISKTYQIGDSVIKAVNNVSCTIRKGEFVALTGASGSGKSTLLHILAAQDNISDGDFYFNGNNLRNADDHILTQFRKHEIGIVFQQFNLLKELTVLENIALPLAYAGINKFEREERAKRYAEKVGLGERLHHTPNELSGGQAQRVAIARALISEPHILLADEPTGALDSKTGKEILQLFQDLHKDGMTIVMVTHDLDIAKQAERQIHMKDGVIQSDNHPFHENEKGHSLENSKHDGDLSFNDLLNIGIFEGLLAHKLRTALTMLGIIIGVASVLIMSAISDGSEKKQVDAIRALGANKITVKDKHLEDLKLNKARIAGSWGLNKKEAYTLKKQFKEIETISLVRYCKFQIEPGVLTYNPDIYAVDEHFTTVNNLKILKGRNFNGNDILESKRILLLGREVLSQLKNKDVGSDILLNGLPYRIIGIVESSLKLEDSSDIVSPSGFNNKLYIPLNTALNRSREILIRNQIDEYNIKVTSEDALAAMGKRLTKFLSNHHRGQNDYEIIIPLELIKAKQESQKIMRVLSICICAISLIVGGIGIMNIMLASVRERRKEIGIRRAIGATQKNIMHQFLIESVLISFTGAIVGLVFSILLILIISQSLNIPFVFSFLMTFISISAAILTGLVFGFYPAKDAAMQNLVDILRSE